MTVVKKLDNYIESGQIEILDYRQWYIKSWRKLDLDKVLQGWLEKEALMEFALLVSPRKN